MFPEGTKPEQVTEAEARQCIHLIDIYAKAKGIKRYQISRDLNHGTSVITETLNMKYKGCWQQVILDLDAWLDRRRKADSVSQDRPFVPTEVAREIYGIAEIVHQEHWIGLIYSPDSSGIGKTMTLQAIHHEMAGSMLITCDKLLSSTTAMVQAIAREAGVDSVSASSRPSQLYPQIVKKLVGTNRLLILDQVHNLRDQAGDKPFYVLADLWEATKAPQLWVGTANLKAYFARNANHDQSLRQIASRIGLVRDILDRARDRKDGGSGEPLFTIDDIRTVFGSNKIRLTPDAERFLCKLACLPDAGGLRTCDNLVRIATRGCARENLSAIDTTMLLRCLKLTVQSEEFRQITTRIEIEQPRQRMAAAG